ncbi:transcription factor Ouib-like [Drosophila madeirensis]|uniref:Transcription factor Ouib-like n=1 Tax=Drosophila madeirensis TaxID=30013 RepID=A0AAU9F6R4_DROMD
MKLECRACGEQIFISNPKNLFDKENSLILLRIKQLTGIPFKFEENLPTHICSCCLLDLNQATVFRDRCLKTHKRLHLKAARVQDAVEETHDPLDENVQPADTYDDDDVVSEEFSEPEEEQTHVFPALEEAKKIKKTEPSPRSAYPRVMDKRTRLAEGTLITLSATKTPGPDPKRITSAKEAQRMGSGQPKKKRKRAPCLEKKYVCDQCGWSFNDISNMRDHKLRHSEKKFVCKDCDSYFYTAAQLKMHVRVKHNGEKPFLCKYCGMAFTNSPSRCRHERRYHSNDLPFGCVECGKTFISKVGLAKHGELHKGGGTGKFYCDICEKEFKEAIFLRGHYQTKYHLTRARKYEDACEYEAIDEDGDIDFDLSESVIDD